MRAQDWRTNYYEAIRERNEAEAKLERVAQLTSDLHRTTGARWIADMLDSILFAGECKCPAEDGHCGECGCCPDEDDDR